MGKMKTHRAAHPFVGIIGIVLPGLISAGLCTPGQVVHKVGVITAALQPPRTEITHKNAFRKLKNTMSLI